MNKIERTCPESFKIDKIGRVEHYDKNKDKIRKKLTKLTQLHCSYCDCLLHISEYTPHIEHFKPTKLYPNLKIVWHNLFASCPKCNSIKGSKFPKNMVLKPDTKNYNFDYWFEIDWKTNKIKPNEYIKEEEKLRAETTINLFGLNEVGRPNARKRELQIFQDRQGNIDEYSYRFFIERA